MANDKSDLVAVWKNSYCEKAKKHKPFTLSKEISKMVRFFPVGKSYFYVINFHNMELDRVNGETKSILGLGIDDFSLENLLDRFSPQEYEEVEKKEKLIADFRVNRLDTKDIADYKIVHFLDALDRNGNKKLIMHQSMPISVNSDGSIQHVIGVHTDVSHLDIIKDQSISFININDGISYKNVNPGQGFLSQEKERILNRYISDQLTSREMQICRLLSEGSSSKDISDRLKITLNTVNTHRRKILKKTDCNNSVELINKFLTH